MAVSIQTIANAIVPTGYTGSQGITGYTGSFGYTGSQGLSGKVFKTVAIEYPAVESIPLFFIETSLIINKIVATVVGAGANTSFLLYYGENALSSGTEVVVGGTTVTQTNNQIVLESFDNNTIPANNFLWITVISTTSTDWLNININFN